jgi:hypothetical protein
VFSNWTFQNRKLKRTLNNKELKTYMDCRIEQYSITFIFLAIMSC